LAFRVPWGNTGVGQEAEEYNKSMGSEGVKQGEELSRIRIGELE
jgi:hypothetical protein